jgi:hypothetical protein
MRNYKPIKTPERLIASSEASYRHFLKTPAHDSLQEIFVILQEEKDIDMIIRLRH